MQVLFRRYFIGICMLALAIPTAFAEERVEYFTPERLEQLVAPIALYPDALVAQVLMASTYPLQVTQAARWLKRHSNLKDQELDRAAQGEPWDPSVKSLLHFRDLLDRMNENLDWTRDLGDAVLAQQPAVMEAIQRMRRYAHEAGNLQSNDKQRVVVEEKVIRVEPATEVVYVPAYNPTVVYGGYWAPSSWYYPLFAYPYDYWYPVGYPAYGIVSFGVGVLVGAAIWGHCDWYDGWIGYHDYHHHWHGGGDVYVDRSLTINNYDGHRPGPTRWEHNPLNRRGVAYRDPDTTRRYDAVRRDLTQNRQQSGALGPATRPTGRQEAPRGYDLMGRRAAPGALDAPSNRPGGASGAASRAVPSGPGSVAGRNPAASAGDPAARGERPSQRSDRPQGVSRGDQAGPTSQRTLGRPGDTPSAGQSPRFEQSRESNAQRRPQNWSRPTQAPRSAQPSQTQAPRSTQRPPSMQAPSRSQGAPSTRMAPSSRAPTGGGYGASPAPRGMAGPGPRSGGGFSGPGRGWGGSR